MNGLFFETNAATNEDYKKVIKSRMRTMVLLFILGIITLGVSLYVKSLPYPSLNEHMTFAYMGVGTGLTAAAAVLWIRYRLMIKNDAALKKNRLADTDERNLEISRKAFQTATVVLLVACYAAGLIGGFFYPILFRLAAVLAAVFLLSYFAALQIFRRKM